MTNTTNYNLNIVEGTDIVNPLTQLNPNFNTIDGVMKANADAAVTAATCIKAGTVHTITRSNTGAEMFVFTATGDWNEGDTMTVDGTPVTPVLPDGTALLSGSYLINAEVLASIKGSKVTIYSNKANLPTITGSDVEISAGVTLDDALNAITDVDSDDYTSITLTDCVLRMRKRNGVMVGSLSTQATTTGGAETEVLTLPAKYRPSSTFTFCLTGTANNYCRIQVDGRVFVATNNAYASGSVAMI